VGPGEFSFKNVHIGKGVRIDYGCRFLAILSRIYVGDKCMIAAGCDIVAGNHNTVCDGRFMSDITNADKRDFDDTDVVLEEDVWLGRRVIVLNGARIGRGAVVGAGSVIRRRVPPYGIVIGNPARVVSFRAGVQEILSH
jgi:acetyltransferase-like isoleucine patch superfamily enzyme